MAGPIQGHIRKHGMERHGANPGWIQSQPWLSCRTNIPPDCRNTRERAVLGCVCALSLEGGLGVAGEGHCATGQGG